jgi:hypothetical protein
MEWDLICLATLALPVSLVAHAVTRLPVYATADAGISLADADSLIGRGIRPAGHLPVFPLLTNITRLVASDLVTFQILAVVIAVLFPLSFYFFVRGRTGSPLAEVIGTAVIALAPTTAEAIGWYGLTMLVGIALAFVALRTIDDWLLDPTTRRALIAGVVVVALALTHSFAFLWLVQVAGVAVAATGGAVWLRNGRNLRAPELRTYARTAAILGAFAAAAVVMTLISSRQLEPSVSLSPNLRNLRLVETFGFRESRLWLGGLALGLAGAPFLASRMDAKTARLARWGALGGVVALVNLVALGGDSSYLNRQVYFLPFCICVGFAVLIAFAVQLERRGRRQLGAALFIVVCSTTLSAAPTFAHRMDRSAAFYNRISEDELDGIRWVGRQPGALLVASSDSNFYDGTTVSWLVQGLARRNAFSVTEGYRNLFARDRSDSDDVGAILAGAHATSRANLMVGTQSATGAALVLARLDNAWYPLSTLRIADASRSSTPLTRIVGRNKLEIVLPASSRLEISGAPATAFASVTRSPDSVKFAEPNGKRSFVVRGGEPAELGASIGVGNDRNMPVTLTMSIRGFQDEPVRSRAMTADQLLERHGIRMVWTSAGSWWRGEFEARGYPVGYENDGVVIFRVPGGHT